MQVLATRRAASAHVRVAFPTPKHITFANSFAGVRVPAQIALQRRVCASRVTAVSPVAEISYVMVKPGMLTWVVLLWYVPVVCLNSLCKGGWVPVVVGVEE